MEVLHPRCAGLDVHKDSVVACVRCVSAPKAKEVRSFKTTTGALIELAEWLQTHGVTHVVMEATGVYWKPVWHILEEHFELVLANAQHVRNVPGRKSDVSDAAWLADLLAHGLVSSSFVPPAFIQEVRDLTRTRKQLVREVAQHVQRIQKVLETCNVKLASVLTDIMGKSGRAMLDAIIAGEDDPERLADLARGTARKKRPDLVEALRGRVTDHHRRMLALHLNLIGALEASIADVDATLGKSLEPVWDAVDLLNTIPGVSNITAQVIVAEIGVDMDRFPSAAHLVSWAGLCPRSDESAGKRRSTRIRKSGTWLKTTLVSAAWAAARKKDGYLRALFLRLKSRRGPKKAIIAVAAAMLTAVYHMLRRGTEYRDLGANYLTHRDKAKAANRLVRRLKTMGFDVALTPAA